MSSKQRQHKWWGWGNAGQEFDMQHRPRLWPWIKKTLSFSSDQPTSPCLPRDQIVLPARQQHPRAEFELLEFLAPEQILESDDERLRHCYGRSLRDLIRLRAGIFSTPPDLVIYPESEAQILSLLSWADHHQMVLIPFGGGTNIVGCLECDDPQRRMIVVLDMARMNQMLDFDSEAQTATFQAGIFGPDLEKQLASKGFALGHHPDSFLFSTLGGWLATRSAGTHSNAYGKIEDMVVSMNLASPAGVIKTKKLPAASHGPSLNQTLVGSEGTLGIITQATMQIHPKPSFEKYHVMLFPSFDNGFHALHECAKAQLLPAVARLSDEAETDFILNAKHASSKFKKVMQAPVKRWLKARGYHQPAMLILGIEGPAHLAKNQRKHVFGILKKHRAFDLGTKAGEQWKKRRYDIPYLRDYLLDYRVLSDSMETSTVWSNVMTLYLNARETLLSQVKDMQGVAPYLGCHLSHLYPTGACLYFTVAVRAKDGSSAEEMIEQYDAIKHLGTQTLMENHGALSHHHAVGREHRPWMEKEHSATGLELIRALKEKLDPQGTMNPGTLIPPTASVSPQQHDEFVSTSTL